MAVQVSYRKLEKNVQVFRQGLRHTLCYRLLTKLERTGAKSLIPLWFRLSDGGGNIMAPMHFDHFRERLARC
ncbi:hypothetical protein [Pelagibacterium sp. H642]|uniref:hypothetical protein n=1 Tax=Pelagibacterium sp. H642 TaxID=1881069 RepID=UPI0028157E50|nr:hypothetical protein [Pelagibacterium sp. H642]WMT91015.1 hypothetical protein NO934_01805 [Pelagibacterium sp. H642]